MSLKRFVVLLTILVAATGCDRQGQQPPPSLPSSQSTLASAPLPQRYQIVISPHLRADTFLVDTQKGRVWQMTKFSDMQGQPSAWMETDIIDSTGEIGMTLADFMRQNSRALTPERKNQK